MKKAFFKLLLVVLGLNVFTACYGPAPGGGEWLPEPETEQTEDTKATGQADEAQAEEAPAEADAKKAE